MTPASLAEINTSALKDALRELEQGKCVAIPTETVYGLAADATNGEAVARIFEMKNRPQFNPLICHVSGLDMARQYGCFSTLAETLAKAFWPGPLTLVVPLAENSSIHPLVTAGLDSVGLRHPRGISCALIGEFGKPLAAPSANRSGRVSPTTADHVRSEFDGQELVIIDDGACEVGLESTIVKVDGDELIMLRPGGITSDMIHEVTGIRPVASKGDKIEAPGMMMSHYAPDAELVLDCETCASGSAWLQFGSGEEAHSPSRNLSASGDLREAAANLYSFIKELDCLGVDQICVSPIPETGLGIAINDRLRRAAAPRGAHEG